MKKQLAYRVAHSDDEPGILKIFEEVAPEVPTAVRSGTEELIKRYVKSGQSWVAVDADGGIIGYALAEPHDLVKITFDRLTVNFLKTSCARSLTRHSFVNGFGLAKNSFKLLVSRKMFARVRH